ncbi:hypothetical protein D3C72_2178280 [compost metagenome]
MAAAVITAAIIISAATVIDRRRINDRGRDINRSRAVINRGRRRHVDRLRRDVNRSGIHDPGDADGNPDVNASQGDAGDQQTRGTDTCDKPFFHVAPACRMTQQS